MREHDELGKCPISSIVKMDGCSKSNSRRKKLITERFALIERHIEESVYLMSRPKFILNEQQQSTYVLCMRLMIITFSASNEYSCQ